MSNNKKKSNKAPKSASTAAVMEKKKPAESAVKKVSVKNTVKPETPAKKIITPKNSKKGIANIISETKNKAAAPLKVIKSKASQFSKPEKVKKEPKPVEVEAKIDQVRNIKERLFSLNPVFVRILAVVPLLGAAVSLKNGVMLSCAMLLTLLPLNLLLIPIYRFVPERYRFAISFAAAGIIITPVCLLTDYLVPTITSSCGIYLPLIAVCALLLTEKKHFGKKYVVPNTARDALLNGLGFAFAAVIFSALREIISNGSFYDRALPYISGFKFKFAAMPAGAFILLAVLAALFRKISKYKKTDGEDMK